MPLPEVLREATLQVAEVIQRPIRLVDHRTLAQTLLRATENAVDFKMSYTKTHVQIIATFASGNEDR